MGSGSDYAPMIQRVGLPSCDVRYTFDTVSLYYEDIMHEINCLSVFSVVQLVRNIYIIDLNMYIKLEI